MTSFCAQRHAAFLGERGSKIDNTLVYYRKLSHGFITLPEGVLCDKKSKKTDGGHLMSSDTQFCFLKSDISDLEIMLQMYVVNLIFFKSSKNF